MIKKLADIMYLPYTNNQGDIDIALNGIMETWEPTRDPYHCTMVRDWLFERFIGVKIITTLLERDGIKVELQVPGLENVVSTAPTYEEAFCGAVIELYKKPRSKEDWLQKYPNMIITSVEHPESCFVNIVRPGWPVISTERPSYSEALNAAFNLLH